MRLALWLAAALVLALAILGTPGCGQDEGERPFGGAFPYDGVWRAEGPVHATNGYGGDWTDHFDDLVYVDQLAEAVSFSGIVALARPDGLVFGTDISYVDPYRGRVTVSYEGGSLDGEPLRIRMKISEVVSPEEWTVLDYDLRLVERVP